MSSWKETGKQVAGGVAVVAGVGAGVYFSLVLADLLTFYWLYSSMANMLQDYGTVASAAKVVGMLFAGVVTILTHRLLWHIVSRNKQQWVPRITAIMVIWYGAMYVVASPYERGLFNPFTGAAQAKFVKMPDGTIKKFPKGLQFDPETGRSLSDFDTATADEYNAQYGVQKKSFLSGVWDSTQLAHHNSLHDTFHTVAFWVEKISTATDRTVVGFAAKTANETAGSIPEADTSQCYLVDGNGNIYHYSSSVTVVTLSGRQFLEGAGSRVVLPGEIHHFEMVYEPLRPGVNELKVYDSRFVRSLGNVQSLELTSFLGRATRIPAMDTRGQATDEAKPGTTTRRPVYEDE